MTEGGEATEVVELVDAVVRSGDLTGATLSKPRRRDPLRPSRLTIEPVEVQGVLRYRWRHHFTDRTTDENLSADETARRLVHLLGGEYRQGLLRTVEADWQVLAGGKGTTVLRRPPSRTEVRRAHDRVKRRILPEGEPVPYLVELGVMARDGSVLKRRYDKFRQVNRFLELVADVVPELPDGPLRVVDFGSGRAYLTFALHDLLTRVHGREVDVLGLDLKEGVVAECEALARRLDAEGLRFEVGDIAGYEGLDEVDLVVSLHACDTATDAALDRAVRWQAAVILAVPCCQHELSPQLDHAVLGPLLRHGVLRERFAAELTDALRAQLLGAVGYDVQLVEFVDLEHTPKNVLIRAVRRPTRDRSRSLAQATALEAELGVDPALHRLLADLLAAG